MGQQAEIMGTCGDGQISPATIKKILKERAAALAKPFQEETGKGAAINGLGFSLSDEQYLIDADYVTEVIHLTEFTPLPCTPAFILGIINVRGRILSVVNLKRFLNLPEKGITNLNRVIVVKHDTIETGLLVDEVTGTVEIFPDRLRPGISGLTPRQTEYLAGITAERSIVLNIKKLLNSKEIIINEEI